MAGLLAAFAASVGGAGSSWAQPATGRASPGEQATTENRWTPITVDQWRTILRGQATDDDDLVALAATHLDSMTNSGDGLRKSLVALALAEHVLTKSDRKVRFDEAQQLEGSVRKLKATLQGRGLTPESLKASITNLSTALGANATRLRLRTATEVERKAMTAEIKSHLIDPTAPIFGPAHIVGNGACVTVNSKNRYGGYTGNQEAALLFFRPDKTWNLANISEMSHDACLDAAQKFGALH